MIDERSFDPLNESFVELIKSSQNAGPSISNQYLKSRVLLTSQVMKFYVVRIGRKPRIYTIWAECESRVIGFHTTIYKSFKTLQKPNTYVTTIESVLHSDRRFYASSREVGLLDFKLHLVRNLGRI